MGTPTEQDLEANLQDKLEVKSGEPVSTLPDEPPFSIYTVNEKRFLVFLAGLAALFSPLSASIYYSALTTLATHFHTSLSNINLTVTTYLVCTSASLSTSC